MQRGTDIQFLRDLARRNGKLCRVGRAPTSRAQRTGYFAKPELDGDPVGDPHAQRPGRAERRARSISNGT